MLLVPSRPNEQCRHCIFTSWLCWSFTTFGCSIIQSFSADNPNHQVHHITEKISKGDFSPIFLHDAISIIKKKQGMKFLQNIWIAGSILDWLNLKDLIKNKTLEHFKNYKKKYTQINKYRATPDDNRVHLYRQMWFNIWRFDNRWYYC